MSEKSKCRCLNCLERFPIDSNVKEATCPNCKIKYRVSWPWPGQPKIRGLANKILFSIYIANSNNSMISYTFNDLLGNSLFLEANWKFN